MKTNPMKGWYGLKKVPPVLEHDPKNNRMRAT